MQTLATLYLPTLNAVYWDYFVTDAQPPEGYPTVRRETIIAT